MTLTRRAYRRYRCWRSSWLASRARKYVAQVGQGNGADHRNNVPPTGGVSMRECAAHLLCTITHVRQAAEFGAFGHATAVVHHFDGQLVVDLDGDFELVAWACRTALLTASRTTASA